MRHEAIRKVYPLVININGDNNAYDKDGKKVTLDESLIQEELDRLSILEAKDYFTLKANDFIQSKIDEYNEANGTAFTNVHNCESYSRVTSYIHQSWCLQVWTWSVNVWEAVRAYQDTASTIPTDAEFQVVLDGVAF